MTILLSEDDQKQLLELAREALNCKTRGENIPQPDLADYSPAVREKRACFVTLKKGSKLRGCVGCLEARQPLVYEVRDRAVAAGYQDFRFPPVQAEELPQITIEISYLSPPEPLVYQNPEELVEKLNPGVDGVVLARGNRKATFLPQVWEQLPAPEQFLSRLCLKMGEQPQAWQEKHFIVKTYQVEKFREPD
ncbi:MAG: AmmeMemoRadiSam system protein A [Anaerolineales bacterium]|nr:AmmeMemoRadiSam system protein A [Anaerolineales bacterium]